MGTRYTLGSALLVVFSVAIGGAKGLLHRITEGIKARFVGHILMLFIITYSQLPLLFQH